MRPVAYDAARKALTLDLTTREAGLLVSALESVPDSCLCVVPEYLREDGVVQDLLAKAEAIAADAAAGREVVVSIEAFAHVSLLLSGLLVDGDIPDGAGEEEFRALDAAWARVLLDLPERERQAP